jgi:hypothetical protein
MAHRSSASPCDPATIAMTPQPVLSCAPPATPPPAGEAPFVPLIPEGGELVSVGDIIGDFSRPGAMESLFPEPAAPPTPVREMPMGPPPPLDPRFIPPP